jgi:nitrile hydratase
VSARFAPGDSVRVAHRGVAGHVRTPQYIRGRCGVVEQVHGAFRNPEHLAYGIRNGPAVELYRVRFPLQDVWPSADSSLDSLDVDLYEHWLEPVGA